jgi:hypothetical protein
MEKVVVVVPIYKRYLSPDDHVSIQSFLKHLKGYDFHAVVPEHLLNGVEGLPDSFQYTPFPDRYFRNIDSYSRLLLSKEFYAAFQMYDYILIGQTDALVLSSDLQAWCEKGWDYIGAPWAKNFKTHSGIEFEGVGNGGFSLRNVASSIRVLNTKVSPFVDYSLDPKPRWWHWRRIKKVMIFINWFRHFLPKIPLEKYLKKHYYGAEDIFWGKYAKHFDPLISVATIDEALLFSFEADPAGSYEKTGHILPFGCHAWARYDRNFWVKMGVVPEKEK